MSPRRDSRHEVYVTRALPGRALGLLAATGRAVAVHGGDDAPDREELLRMAAPCRGLLALLTDRVDAELLDAAGRLEVVSNYAVGYDNVDVEACTARGVAVTNTPDVLTDATAEVALALLFATARRVTEADRLVRAGRFTGWKPQLLLGVDIRGKTLGVVGAGRIGRAVGVRARALGMEILYCDHERRPDFEEEAGARVRPLEALLAESDFVSLHVPLTDATRGLLGADALATMKPGAILVNTSRGPVVDEKALAEALAAGRLRGAGLDVYEREPAVEPALLALDNVVLLPHLGSATEETRDAMGVLAVENLLHVLDGRRPRHLVNPAAWDRRRGAT